MQGRCISIGPFYQKVMKKSFTIIPILILATAYVISAYAEGPSFSFKHGKGKECAENWLFMEKLLDENGLRCREVKRIQGFPYLRGNKEILGLASKISTKYAEHKWLELLRRIDLQARYAELSALDDSLLKTFCSMAKIDCNQGRIRAYIARCSAIIMGDEKANKDFMKILKKNAVKSLNGNSGKAICFQDSQTLDGLLGADVLSSIFTPPPKAGRSLGRLQERIQLYKRPKPY